MRVAQLVWYVILIIFITLLIWGGLLYSRYGKQTVLNLLRSSPGTVWNYTEALVPSPTQTPQASLAPIPPTASIATMSHAYQKLNNCGPVTASMVASVYGITFDQFFAADRLKSGPGDKNVSPDELVAFLQSQGLKAVYRIAGTTDVIERLVAAGIPVIVEQWLVKRENNEHVGHYRVVRGYNQATQIFTTNDSFNGPNFAIPYSQFETWWRPFNRTYIVVYKAEQEQLVATILGADYDAQANIERAVDRAKEEVAISPDGYSYFNLGSSLTMGKRYTEAATAYDTALTKTFPEHFLWYQFGPLEAYYQTAQYGRVREMATELLRQTGESSEAQHYLDLVASQQVGE